MFSHVVVGTNDLGKARNFYDAVLGVLGYAGRHSADYHAYFSDHGLFKVARPLNGLEATPGNGGTIGFACPSIGQVDRWHAAGLAQGGRAVEQPPGVRYSDFGKLYLAYLRDPDGNKLCGFYRFPD